MRVVEAPCRKPLSSPLQEHRQVLKDQRAAYRQRLFLASGDAPGGFLPRHTVTAIIRERYLTEATHFFRVSGLNVSSTRSKTDRYLSEHLLSLFLSGVQVIAAPCVVYSIKWYLGLALNELPWSLRALKGLRSLAHVNTPDPNALEAVLAAAAAGVQSQYYRRQVAAIASVVQFDLVCKPREVLKITPEWLSRGRARPQGRTALVCFLPSVNLKTDKAKQQDDTGVAGETTKADWISPLLLHLKKSLKVTTPLFPLTLSRYENAFKAKVAAAKLRG